ncbi:YciI family protein [Sulfobacillus thermosulfidooxidans]|uniref:YciI family protein n=1 Tax=Sulfobacillus thermosulfidooxidans TaxID=28034 RepID=UPI001FA930F7|nr:YciI family protein [Sulfobacillus thermosulfidooxidans]
MMAYYAAWLTIVDAELNQQTRPQHLAYLKQLHQHGKVAWAGPFTDKSGGMVIYQTDNTEEAMELAHNDPAVTSGARTVVVKPWELLNFEAL